MKNLIFAASLLFSVSAFANETLIPLSDDLVPASLVTSVQTATSKDSLLNAHLVTVFRGSAAGISSTIVTFAPSLEDNSVSFEFTQIVGEPSNIRLLKKAANLYKLKFDVGVSVYDQASTEFSVVKKTIALLVTVGPDGSYKVERL